MSRVDALIDAVMAKHYGTGKVAQAAYYEDVHQHLAPLARELERDNKKMREALRKIADVHPDSTSCTSYMVKVAADGLTVAENRRLQAERDAAFAMSKCECAPDECCANLVRLHDEIERLRTALRECADELEAEI